MSEDTLAGRFIDIIPGASLALFVMIKILYEVLRGAREGS